MHVKTYSKLLHIIIFSFKWHFAILRQGKKSDVHWLCSPLKAINSFTAFVCSSLNKIGNLQSFQFLYSCRRARVDVSTYELRKSLWRLVFAGLLAGELVVFRACFLFAHAIVTNPVITYFTTTGNVRAQVCRRFLHSPFQEQLNWCKMPFVGLLRDRWCGLRRMTTRLLAPGKFASKGSEQ